MCKGIRRLCLVACTVGLSAPSSSKAAVANDATLAALAAKAAAIRDYHYRLEVARGGIPVRTIELWYAGPDKARVAYAFPRVQDGWETIVRGDEAYLVNFAACEVAKLDTSDPQPPPLRSETQTVCSFLNEELLRLWGKAQVTGAEAVGGVPCHIVDVPTPGPRLSGGVVSDWLDWADFVAFVPQMAESGVRLWVDDATGMIRRRGRLTNGRVREVSEVTEVQRVNGFVFPAAIREPHGDVERITQVTVNQGLGEALDEFRPPTNWLVKDEALTLDQVLDRLQAAPDDANLHYTLGVIYQRGQRFEDMAEEFRRAAELAPDSPTPLLAMGAVRAWYRLARARQEPISLWGGLLLIRALKAAGKIDEAVAEYRRLMAEGSPVSYIGLSELVRGLAAKGDVEEAYRLATDVAPPMICHLGLRPGTIAEWATKSNHLDDLLAKAEQAVAADPTSAQARLLLATVLHAQGRDTDAAETLKGASLSSEAVSLAEALGETELAVRARRSAFRAAIEWGGSGPIYNSLRREQLTDLADSDLIGEAAAMWADADDRRLRQAIVRNVSQIARWIHSASAGGDQGWPQVEPNEMTPSQCVIVGVLAARAAEYAPRPEAKAEARERAQAYCERALAEWPADAALWGEVGMLRWSAEDWGAAAEAYERAAAGDPEEIEYPARRAFALILMAQAHLRPLFPRPGPVPGLADQCALALQTARQAAEPWPEEWAATTFLASVQMDCGDFRSARDTLAPVDASPEMQASYRKGPGRLLARCHEQLGELDQAEAILKRGAEELAAQTDYRRWDGYERLIEFYARHDRRADVYATARRLYLRADGPRDLATGEVQSAFRDDRDGLAAAVRADLETHPGDAGVLEFAAAICDRIEMVSEAMSLLREAAEKANNADLWVQLADMAQRSGDGGLVAEALRRAVGRKPKDRELRGRYAYAAAVQGDTAPAKALADELRAEAGESPEPWRKTAELYLTARSWDDALAAAERLLALTPETDEPARMRAQMLVARAYAGKRDDHEARRRLMPILAQAQDSTVLRGAGEALVELYLLRAEREQAISTLNDLRVRTKDRDLLNWIDQRLKEIAGE